MYGKEGFKAYIYGDAPKLLTELKRCKNINRVRSIKVMVDVNRPSTTGEIKKVQFIKIVTYNQEYFHALMSEWPQDSFGCKRLKPEPGPIGLSVVIQNVNANAVLSQREIQ